MVKVYVVYVSIIFFGCTKNEAREKRGRGGGRGDGKKTPLPPLLPLFAPALFYARPAHIMETHVTQAIKRQCCENHFKEAR